MPVNACITAKKFDLFLTPRFAWCRVIPIGYVRWPQRSRVAANLRCGRSAVFKRRTRPGGATPPPTPRTEPTNTAAAMNARMRPAIPDHADRPRRHAWRPFAAYISPQPFFRRKNAGSHARGRFLRNFLRGGTALSDNVRQSPRLPARQPQPTFQECLCRF